MRISNKFLACVAVSLALWLGIVHVCFGATYYIDCNADGDAGAGTSTATNVAWKTIAKVNASSFSAGDSVLFNKGCTWREQLTVPSSGSAGSPITFGAYGTGAAPIINGADIITGWENSWPSDETLWATTLDGGDLANDWCFRMLIAASSFTMSGTSIQITLQSGSASTSSVAGCYIGEKAASGDVYDMEPGTISQFLFSGSGTTTISSNSQLTSDELTYTFDKAKNYIISLGVSAGAVRYKVVAGSGNAFKGASSAEAGTADVSSYSAGASNRWGLYSVKLINSSGGSQANTWAAIISGASYEAWFDSTRGSRVASVVAVNGANEYYAPSGRIYAYSATDPDSAFAQVEVAQRTASISLNSKNYITVDGLHLTKTNTYGAYNGGTNVIIQNCTIDYLGGSESFGGYAFLTTAINCQALNNIINYIYGSGIGTTANGLTVTGNNIKNCWNGLEYPNQIGRGVYIDGDSSSVSRNYIEACSGGIFVTGSSDASIFDNVLVNQKVNGIDIQAGVADHPTLVYNNSIKHQPTGVAGHGIAAQLSTESVKIKNNTIYCDFTGTNTNVQCLAIAADDYNDVDIDYNLYFLEVGSTADLTKLESTTYTTLADWKTALSGTSYSGQDAHSLNADPLFVSTSNFHLKAISPAINAGVDVGLTTDFDGKKLRGLTDMGAYEYQGGAAAALMGF